MATCKFVFQISVSFAYLLCWNSCYDGERFHVLGDDGTGTDDSSFADFHIVEHSDVATQPRSVTHMDRSVIAGHAAEVGVVHIVRLCPKVDFRTEVYVLTYIYSLTGIEDAVVAHDASLADVEVHTAAYLTTEIDGTRLVLVDKVDMAVHPVAHGMAREHLDAVNQITLIPDKENKNLVLDFLSTRLFFLSYELNVLSLQLVVIYPPPFCIALRAALQPVLYAYGS